jgi:hypothetical protein
MIDYMPALSLFDGEGAFEQLMKQLSPISCSPLEHCCRGGYPPLDNMWFTTLT